MSNDELISYTSPRGQMITTRTSDAVASWKKDTAAAAAGKWFDKRGFEALSAALEAQGIDPAAYVAPVATAAPAPVATRRRHISYTSHIDAAGDINNLLRDNGNAAAAE